MHIEAKLRELGLTLPAPIIIPPGARLPFAFVRVRGNRAPDFLPPLVDRERRVEMYARLHLQNLRARI